MEIGIRAKVIVVAIVLLTAALAAQPPASRPTFETEARAVLVHCFVAGKDGRPVRGLTAADFKLKEDGREQPIVFFSAVDAANGAPPATGAPVESPEPAGAQPMPLAAVLLVDDGNLSAEQAVRVRPGLKSFVASLGEVNATLSLVALGSRISVAERLPSGSEKFMTAIDRLVGQHPVDRSNFPVADAEALAAERGDEAALARISGRFAALNPDLPGPVIAMYAHNRALEVAHDARSRRDSFYQMAGLALDWLAKQPGRRRLVIASAGFPREPNDFTYTEIVNRSMRVNAPIDFIDVRGLRGVGYDSVRFSRPVDGELRETTISWSENAEGATTLADDTGGTVLGNGNDIGALLPRLIDTLQAYYVLGYESPEGKPGLRKIAVDMNRPGLSVRARRGYFVTAAKR